MYGHSVQTFIKHLYVVDHSQNTKRITSNYYYFFLLRLHTLNKQTHRAIIMTIKLTNINLFLNSYKMDDHLNFVEAIRHCPRC